MKIKSYDESNETFQDYQKINLKNVEKLELGPEPVSSQQTFFKSSNLTSRFYVIRFYYRNSDEQNETVDSGYFHTFRSCNLRFFNNLVITTKSMDELTESLRGICHTIQSTASYYGFDIEFEEANKLMRLAGVFNLKLYEIKEIRSLNHYF